jgi:ActR/RegA family two-component response regulator
MMKIVVFAMWFSIGTAIATLAGCASDPPAATPADVMREHASEAQAEADSREALAEEWERGQKLVESGNQKIESGERQLERAQRDLERAREQVQEGTREVAEGEQLARNAELQFSERFPGVVIQAEGTDDEDD